jgi:ATP-dependent Clp protease adapter protein ClpS
MLDAPDRVNNAEITLLNDDSTPWHVVTGMLSTVFAKTAEQAGDIAMEVHKRGQASLGAFPRPVAEALHRAATAYIEQSGQRLQLNLETAAGYSAGKCCSFCGNGPGAGHFLYTKGTAAVCEACLLLASEGLSAAAGQQQFHYAYQALVWHFAGIPKDRIVSTSRNFPGHMRADVQAAVDQLFAGTPIRFFGIHEEHRYETMTLSTVMKGGQHAPVIAPVGYEDVDIGEDEPVKCARNGLWLMREDDLRYAVVLSEHREYGMSAGVRIEIGVPAGERGAEFTSQCFKAIETAVHASRSYRGKVLSLESGERFSGKSSGMAVHRLPPVSRTEVILSAPTLHLLDRNIFDFVNKRESLRALGQPTRKGILLYGPPGTGKTHTIRYIASNLPGHTTLLITGGQIGLLAEYMMLARLLQPSIVVIEDADLIARDREQMSGPCEESLLNRLLNEMDGLKGDADILFILTTNRPEHLEGALAGRPGRIDQAIEIPLPDDACRASLIHLYGGRLKLDDIVVATAVKRTAGVSAAFIKEMMRRTAQASIERGSDRATVQDIDLATDDMLFTGGKLNVSLLGGTERP